MRGRPSVLSSTWVRVRVRVRIEGPAVRVEQHLHAVDGRVERVGADGATLNVHGRGEARFRWAVAGLGLG